VRDTGIGLSPAEQAKLFNKFFRSDSAEVRSVGGSGLGLFITRSLVELQGGEMSFVSALQQGSTFSFTLPTAPQILHFRDAAGGEARR
jgi:signal transduction histidine kinase